jgi:hypothetical protein
MANPVRSFGFQEVSNGTAHGGAVINDKDSGFWQRHGLESTTALAKNNTKKCSFPAKCVRSQTSTLLFSASHSKLIGSGIQMANGIE